MSTLFVNPNSLYSNSQENFILNKDALYAFTRSISTVNDTLYGMQPTRDQLLNGFSLSDVYAVNPISSNHSICANVDKLEQKISSVGTDISALEFFATKKFVKCTSELDRDQRAKNPLAVYLTPIPVDEYIPGKRPLSKRKLMNGLKELGKWNDFEAYLKATSDGANGTLWDQWDASTTLDEDNELVQGAIAVLKDQFGMTEDQVEVLLEDSIAQNGQYGEEPNDFYEWIYVLSGDITWQELQNIAISAETLSDFHLTSIPGDWELIGSTSITDGKLNSILNDFTHRIEEVSKISDDLSDYLALSGGNRNLSNDIYLSHYVNRLENPAAGKIQLYNMELIAGYYVPYVLMYYLSSKTFTEIFDQIAEDDPTGQNPPKLRTFTYSGFECQGTVIEEDIQTTIENASRYSDSAEWEIMFTDSDEEHRVSELQVKIVDSGDSGIFDLLFAVRVAQGEDGNIFEDTVSNDPLCRFELCRAVIRLLKKYNYENLNSNCFIQEEILGKDVTLTLQQCTFESGWSGVRFSISNVHTDLEIPLSQEPYAITTPVFYKGTFLNDKYVIESELSNASNALNNKITKTSSDIISEINRRGYLSTETDPQFITWKNVHGGNLSSFVAKDSSGKVTDVRLLLGNPADLSNAMRSNNHDLVLIGRGSDPYSNYGSLGTNCFNSIYINPKNSNRTIPSNVYESINLNGTIESNSYNSIALRGHVFHDSNDSIAIGSDTAVRPNSNDSIVIGNFASTDGKWGMAIGGDVFIGNSSTYNVSSNIVIGEYFAESNTGPIIQNTSNAKSDLVGNLLLGFGKSRIVDCQHSIAIGTDVSSTANSGNSIAIGHGAGNLSSTTNIAKYLSTFCDAIAIGTNAKTRFGYNVAIGSNSYATAQGGIAIGPSAIVSGSSNTIWPNYLHNGAIQLGTGTNLSNNFQVWNWELLNQATGYIPYERLEALSVTPNFLSAGNNVLQATPTSIVAGIDGQLLSVENPGINPKIVIGRDVIVADTNNVQFGYQAGAQGDSIAIGREAYASDSSIAIGSDEDGYAPYATGGAIAIGYGAKASDGNAVQIGPGENTISDTFKYRDTVVVNSDGVIPAESIESGIAPSSIARLSDTTDPSLLSDCAKLSDLNNLSTRLISNDISAISFNDDTASLQFKFNNRNDVSSVSIENVLNKLAGDDGITSHVKVTVENKIIKAELRETYFKKSEAILLSNILTTDYNTKIHNVNSDLSGRIDSLSNELTALSGKVEINESNIADLRRDVNGLRTDLDALSTTVEHITSAYISRENVTAAVNTHLNQFSSFALSESNPENIREMLDWMRGLHLCLSSLGIGQGGITPPIGRSVTVSFYNSGDKSMFDSDKDYIGTLTGNAPLTLTLENTKTFNDQISSWTLLGKTHSLNGWIDVNSETTYMLSDIQNEQIAITFDLSVLPSYD